MKSLEKTIARLTLDDRIALMGYCFSWVDPETMGTKKYKQPIKRV